MNSHKIMFITRPNNWQKLIDKNLFWPLNFNEARTANQLLTIGDEILVYLSKKSGIAGVLIVTGEIKQSQEPIYFDGRTYEYILPIKYYKILTEESIVRIKPFLGDLDLTKKRQENWGSIFQKSLVKLTSKDFEFLKNKISFSEKVS